MEYPIWIQQHLLTMNLNRKASILDQMLHSLEIITIKKIEMPIAGATKGISNILQNNSGKKFEEILITIFMDFYYPEIRERTEKIRQATFTEVVWMLEKYYRGNETEGFDGALYDATQNQAENIQIVLARFVEIIRTIEQKKYINGLLNFMIDPGSWDLKYTLVQEILDRYGHLYPPELKKLSPAQLVNQLEELILIAISSNQFARSLFSLD
ncbi:MAG: hypothetical protein H8E14_15410 [Candidatus Marinimicrobia bacterium]|nr:hypothetical protein [Candidatus Neomarinimicrobiota bacterium]